MARTWAVSARKLQRLRRLDAIGRVLAAPFGIRRPSGRANPIRILVVEIWHLGDVVLTTPFLQALRASYPDARISLLAKPHAEALLSQTGFVDEFIAFDFPWTAFRDKYRLSRYPLAGLLALFRQLRRQKFDVSFDARMDLRSNLLTFLIGARRRIGFDYGGGSYLLTDAVPVRPDDDHKVDDWMKLLAPLGVAVASSPTRLRVGEAERADAREFLAARGIDGSRPLVGIHPGANQPVRKWPLERFAHVADAAARLGADVIVFDQPDGYGSALRCESGATHVSLSLRRFMAVLEQCGLLVCNDSGPMHIAAALEVPVIAIFGPQCPEWYGPAGTGHRVVINPEVACRPCFDSCRFAEPFCITDIPANRVVSELEDALAPTGRMRDWRLPMEPAQAKFPILPISHSSAPEI